MSEWKPTRFFSDAEIQSAMTPKGGFSRETMAKFAVPWPPPKGWRKAITMAGARERVSESGPNLFADFGITDAEEKHRKLQADVDSGLYSTPECEHP